MANTLTQSPEVLRLGIDLDGVDVPKAFLRSVVDILLGSRRNAGKRNRGRAERR